MNGRRFSRKALATILMGGAFTLASVEAHAATIFDPVLSGPGVDTIDPAGNEEVDFVAPGSTPQATLEARPGFLSVQDFTGFLPGDNTISFTDVTVPDIQVRLNSVANGGGASNAAAHMSSPGAAIVIDANANSPFAIYTIDFGSYDTGSDTFDSNTNSVRAAGFVITQSIGSSDFVVRFLDNNDNILKNMVFNGAANTDGNGNQGDFYVGFESTQRNISSILVMREDNTGSSGLDDLAFTPVPEPASALLVALGLSVLAARRR